MFGIMCHRYLILAVAIVGAPLLLPQQAAAFSDLAVKMEASPDSVALGQSVTYSVSVTNLGPDPARYITVSDNLPKGASLQSITSTNGTCASIAGIPFCNLEGMAKGDTETITITIVVDEKQPHGKLFNTIHAAASKNKGEPKENNHAETITIVQEESE